MSLKAVGTYQSTMDYSLSNPVDNPLRSRQTTKSDPQSATLPDIELQCNTITGNYLDHPSNERLVGHREFSLPPVDTGKDAWLCLIGAFVLEMVVWVFQVW